MDCMDIRDKLFDYMEGNLGDREKEMIELHIESCRECKREYEEVLEASLYLQKGFESINAPLGFMREICQLCRQISSQVAGTFL